MKDFGAVGDGMHDDSLAIIAALTSGRSDNGSAYPNANYSPSTHYPAYIFFDKGVYLVTQTLPVIYNTEIVGDAEVWPTIKFVVEKSPNLTFALDAAGAWYHDVSENNFYRHIRNFVVDLSASSNVAGINWKLSQATTLVNVHFTSGIGSTNIGMIMPEGSGGFFADVVFDGGLFGMLVGNQQFTCRNVTIRDASIAAVQLNWDWVWTFAGLVVERCPVGIDLIKNVGSLVVIDSSFSGITTAVIRSNAFDNRLNRGTNSIYLENIDYIMDLPTSTKVLVANGTDAVQLVNESVTRGFSFAQGHMFKADGTVARIQEDISSFLPPRPSVLTVDGKYLQRTRPELSTNLLNLSTLGIIGDGVTDVTKALQQVILDAAGKVTLYVPFGTYIISDTVYLPAGTKIIGEVWPIFMANGEAFSNPKEPKPMFQVGFAGEIGVAWLLDIIISTKGSQPGAILVEWNMHEPVDIPGGCGIWSVHFRIGGADGTDIGVANCLAGDGSKINELECTGAYLLMHVTKFATLYMENSWQWVADHDIDHVKQINVYNARGFLCESNGPVWLYGTAVEHNLYYQYNFHGASNVFMGVIQTETPYFQPSIWTPFLPLDPLDPTFCTDDFRCNMAYALNIKNSNNIFAYGTGLYSFFNTWSQACLKTPNGPICQKSLVSIHNSSDVYIAGLNSYGAELLIEGYPAFSAIANNNTFCASAILAHIQH